MTWLVAPRIEACLIEWRETVGMAVKEGDDDDCFGVEMNKVSCPMQTAASIDPKEFQRSKRN